MAYIYILSSLPKLYEYIKNILISNKSYFYIEYLNNGIIHYEEITPLNCIEKIKPMRERNMNFYISTKPIEIDKNFYDDGIFPFVIEGKGGREASSTIGLITLRLIAKKTDKSIKHIFNLLKKTLDTDPHVCKGISEQSALHKNIYVLPLSKEKKSFVHDIFLKTKV